MARATSWPTASCWPPPRRGISSPSTRPTPAAATTTQIPGRLAIASIPICRRQATRSRARLPRSAALQVQYGSGLQNGSSGTGGTWTLYNAGPIAGGSGPGSGTNQKGGTDWTNDEYDLSWTVNKTVALKAGDTIDMVTWGVPDSYDYSGSDTAPSYLASSVSTSSITAAPVLTPSGTSNTLPR